MPQPSRSRDSEAVAQVSDSTLAGLVGYRAKRAMTAIQADLARTLSPFGLRMITYSALAVIVDNPGLRQFQLAAALSIERPNLVVIVDELETRDLIRRDKVPRDRRAYALKATIKGCRLCERATRAIHAHEDRFLARLGPAEREALAAALLTIQETLEAQTLEDEAS